jgi:hypothetical protein
VSQTEDVLVDTRGNILYYRQELGVFILRYSEPGAPKAPAK